MIAQLLTAALSSTLQRCSHRAVMASLTSRKFALCLLAVILGAVNTVFKRLQNQTSAADEDGIVELFHKPWSQVPTNRKQPFISLSCNSKLKYLSKK